MITLSSISKGFGDQRLFDEAEFQLLRGEKIGVVGRNGSGKSTLFKLIQREDYLDSGEIIIPKNYRIGHLAQHISFKEPTVLEEVCQGLSQNLPEEKWKAEKVLLGLGFEVEDLEKPPLTFSGGYQVRINLAKVLVSEPDLLLLDEPTNYLDIVSIRWLEKFLSSWPGELMLITHDRKFMDTVCSHTLALHRHKIRKMRGNTEKLFEQIELEEAVHEKTRVNAEKKRKQQEVFISRFRAKARMAGMVQSRVKALEKQSIAEKLSALSSLSFHFRELSFEAKYMQSSYNLNFSYPGSESLLIENFSLNIEPGDCIAVIGKNGKGKSTLLKLLSGEMAPASGTIKNHPLTNIGYYQQTHVNLLNSHFTVEEEIYSAYPDGDRKRAREICGAMMFEGNLALKKIEVLSGGEKSRVCLGKLLSKPYHMLLLDEPTNHLDPESCDALKRAILEFSGAVVLVTHNEDYLESLPNKLVVFDGGQVKYFPGSYGGFLREIGWRSELPVENKDENKNQKSSNKKESRKQRAEFLKRRQTMLKGLNQRIQELEKDIQKKEQALEKCNKQLEEAYYQNNGSAIAELAKEGKVLSDTVNRLYQDLETALCALEEEEEKLEKEKPRD